jgi:hypothetical protein
MRSCRLGSAALVVLGACAAADADDGPTLQLSAEAEPIFDLMVWSGDVVADCDDADALSGVDPAVDAIALEAAATMLAGELLADYSFDPQDGSMRVGTIEREIVSGPDLTDEQQLRDGVNTVLAAMGAAEDQRELEIGSTNSTGGDEGEEPTTQMLSKNVHVQRRVLGLASGDGGRASFEMHGPLIRMNVQWRRVDYDASTLCVDGIETEEQVMAALAEMLANDGFVIEPTTVELQVSTMLRPIEPADETSNIWTLRLVGNAAVIDSRGGTIPVSSFYLDDGVSLAD